MVKQIYMFRIIIIISYTIEHPVSDPLLHPLFFTQIQLPLTLFFPTQNMCPCSYHGHLNCDKHSPPQWTGDGNTIANTSSPLTEIELIYPTIDYDSGVDITLSEHGTPSNSLTHPSPTDSACSRCNGRGCSVCF